LLPSYFPRKLSNALCLSLLCLIDLFRCSTQSIPDVHAPSYNVHSTTQLATPPRYAANVPSVMSCDVSCATSSLDNDVRSHSEVYSSRYLSASVIQDGTLPHICKSVKFKLPSGLLSLCTISFF